MFNSQKYVATYDDASQIWNVEITAPSQSSWSQENHVFLAEIHAEDTAGNTSVLNSTDEDYGDQLKSEYWRKPSRRRQLFLQQKVPFLEPLIKILLWKSRMRAALV